MLVRILPVGHVRDYLKEDLSKISFTDQLCDEDVDKGDDAAVELAMIEDDTLPDVEAKVVLSVRKFVEEFFKKMRSSLPWNLLKILTALNPSMISNLQIKDSE